LESKKVSDHQVLIKS